MDINLDIKKEAYYPFWIYKYFIAGRILIEYKNSILFNLFGILRIPNNTAAKNCNNNPIIIFSDNHPSIFIFINHKLNNYRVKLNLELKCLIM